MPNLIGTSPNQVPVNGMLGTAAFMDREQFYLNRNAVTATGGVMDCSAGDRFTLTVSGNVTLSFTNIPSGSYACVLEVNRTAGTITFPAGTVWPGVAPTLASGRHLFYFDRAQIGTAGWYASSLTGYSA